MHQQKPCYQNAARLGIDREKCLQNLAILKANTELRDKVTEVFNEQRDYGETTNPDYQLYDGFTSHADKAKFAMIRDASPEQLTSMQLDFDDKSLLPCYLDTALETGHTPLARMN